MLIQKQLNKSISQEIWLEKQVQQCFFIINKAKETILDFLQGTSEVF